MLELTVAYDVYSVEKNRGRRVLQPPRWQWFGQTCHHVARWSARKELYADEILRARRELFYRPSEVSDEELIGMPAHEEPVVYADPRRHYQRVASMIHLLVQLATSPDLIFGDYEDLFVFPGRCAGEFLGGDRAGRGGRWFAPLRPECWPEHPAVPPFLVRDLHYVFSPVPLEGAIAANVAREGHLLTFRPGG